MSKAAFAACLALVLGAAGAANAATDYQTVAKSAKLDVPADLAWSRVKGFCNVGAYMKFSCVITSGKDGEIGAVRRLADRLDELFTSVTALSYAYTAHTSSGDEWGTVEVRPDGARGSQLIYTVLYDAAALPPTTDHAAYKAHLGTVLDGLFTAMSASAEGK